MKLVFALALCAGLPSIALSQVTIADGNSSASFTSAGQISWEVDGTSQIFAQEFYFRRATDTREYRLDDTNMNLLGSFATDTNPFSDNRNDAFGQLFEDNNGLQIETLFTIRGGTNGSGNSDLAEQILLRNTSAASMTLTFFQFVDFDLGGDAFDDYGQITGGNTVQQNDDDYFLSETVVTPMPTILQMDSSNNLWTMFNDANADNLDGSTSYSGDVAWAFQWDITLSAGDSFLISKDKSITTIPTPGSISLLGVAGLIAGRRRR